MTGPAPAVAAVRAAVRADLTALLAEAAGASAGPDVDAAADVSGPRSTVGGRGLVLVAVSGGPDSLALAAAVAFVAPRLGLRAEAVVVDHGLQPGSAEVAERAADSCRELGLPARVRAVTPRDPSEAAAREVRHAALAEEAERSGALAVLLGHTRDDQAEQVLLGLARGSGARSLAGMPAVRGLVRRPLLGLPRSVLAQACTDQGLEPWHDPTNHPDGGGALRARVRHELLPMFDDVLGSGVDAALARTADLLRADAEVLDELASDLLDRARAAGAGDPAAGSLAGAPAGSDLLDVATLAAAPEALRTRALRLAVLAWGAPAGSVHAVHVAAVDALVTRWNGQGPADLPGLRVARRCGRLGPLTSTERTRGGRD
ncbi:tRNA lysidine(34) synthetase TilS [Actinotalea sp. M2MS4P-6]|uniref:tRNA lysidine(34) synthetase TilS n=1 Tax=Actinotalea sp. M2MS4P-6 TaxID=2983762 RepID=UPI0021E49ED4|nr:tRNA lysidine(34) synthetase TilS [Actinotalea sp. M2MS4P-6]MCV2394988.1 tRNA lysidine(34) synthetase TilS [Actinotalea sp. M2MS4P-6]